MRSLLLQLHIGLPVSCTAWENVPVTQGVQITVYVHGGGDAGSERCARQCFSLLQQHLLMTGGRRTIPPCGGNGGGPRASECKGAIRDQHRRVLIYIADGRRMIDPDIEAYFNTPDGVIIPIVDDSFGPNLAAQLPAAFMTRLATSVQSFDIGPVLPKIARAAGILSDNFRLFISYRHEDAAAVASQLFHALSEHMFDVFLDRFSSRTGDDFVALIKEELADKACLLVLETPRIGRSAYCRQEVATATKYSLGIMAVDLSGSKQVFLEIPTRLDLNKSPLGDDSPLNAIDLRTVLEFVESNYDQQISRRFRAQDLTLHQSILSAGLSPVAKGIGQYEVDNGTHRYEVGMSSRPPGVGDFIRAEQPAGNVRGILFGPLSVLRTARATEIGWLADKSGVRAIDEGHVQRSLEDIAHRVI